MSTYPGTKNVMGDSRQFLEQSNANFVYGNSQYLKAAQHYQAMIKSIEEFNKAHAPITCLMLQNENKNFSYNTIDSYPSSSYKLYAKTFLPTTDPKKRFVYVSTHLVTFEFMYILITEGWYTTDNLRTFYLDIRRNGILFPY